MEPLTSAQPVMADGASRCAVYVKMIMTVIHH